VLGPCFLDAVANDDEGAGQDLDVVARTAKLLGPAFDIGKEALPAARSLWAAKDHLRRFGGQLPPRVRRGRPGR